VTDDSGRVVTMTYRRYIHDTMHNGGASDSDIEAAITAVEDEARANAQEEIDNLREAMHQIVVYASAVENANAEKLVRALQFGNQVVDAVWGKGE